MSLGNWLRGRMEKARRPRSYRPRLEALEARELMSVCTVDRLTDTNPGGGGQGSNGMGDLRWCISSPADTIGFSVTGTINLGAALPNLARNVSIEGPGANLVTVRRATGGDYAVFNVASGVTASISGLTISNGDVSGIANSGTLTVSDSTISGNSRSGFNGGGILNSGSLTINDSTISGNSASGYSGGGIYNYHLSTVTVNNSTISGNSAGYGSGIGNSGTLAVHNSTISGNTSSGASANGYAGGIYNSNGTLTVSNSTISGNIAGAGGGILNDNTGTVTVNNSTISGNRSSFSDGGGIYLGGGISATLTVSNSTISGNSTNNGGGGIFNVDGSVMVSNTTISGNTAGAGGGIYVAGNGGSGHMVARNTIIAVNTASNGADVLGNLGSQGYNLLGSTQGASGWVSTDLLNANPLLGSLRNNGGPTQTMSLLAGSPALDAGDPTQANVPDQRGVPRTSGVNIGAFQASATTFLVNGFPASPTAGDVGVFTVAAEDPYGNMSIGYRGTIRFTSTDGQATLPRNYTFTAGDNGTHVFGAVLKTAGTQTLTATDTGTATITGTQSGIAVSPAATSTFVVSGFATPTTAGTSGTFTVTAKDPYGNTTPAYRGTAHFTSSDQQAQLPADYPFTAADNGIHTFTATLKTAGLQTITATDTAISGAQAGITVNPADAQTLVVAEFPAQPTAGDIGGFLVTALDPYGNVATGYRGTVTFGSSDPQATLPSDYTFTAGDNGSHPFGAILVTAGTQTITATDTADPTISGTQAGITVAPGAAASFYVAAPDTAVAGEPFDFTLYALDAYGNVATGYTGTVSFYSNSDPSAVLPGDYTFTADDAGTVFFPAGATFSAEGVQDLSVYDTTAGINGVAYVNVIPGGSPLTRMRGFAVDWLFNPSHKKATPSVLDQAFAEQSI